MESPWPEWLDKNQLLKTLFGSKEIVKISPSPAASKGEHFLSTILRIEIEYKNNGDDTINKTSVIVKTFPRNYLQSFIVDNGILTKECKMYKCVLPLMCDILGKKITPSYLNSFKEDILIIEDLKLDNFRSGNQISGLDLNQCISSMIALAEFHGASYMVNKKNPDILECVKKELQFTVENKFQKKFVENSFQIVAEELLNWPNCKKYSDKLLNVKEKMWLKCIKEILPNENEIMVLNHGDFWTNNILFRYDENNKISEVKLIDFQFSRWSSPAVDLQIFFTISLRNKKYKDMLIDTYLKRLNELIQPQCITRNQLLNSLHRTECLALIISVSVFPVLIADPSTLTDVETVDINEIFSGANNNPMIRNACKGDLYKKLFPDVLKYFEDIELL